MVLTRSQCKPATTRKQQTAHKAIKKKAKPKKKSPKAKNAKMPPAAKKNKIMREQLKLNIACR
jgi:hypothetical protein